MAIIWCLRASRPQCNSEGEEAEMRLPLCPMGEAAKQKLVDVLRAQKLL